MTDQNTFMETVRNVADIVRTSAEPMPEEEILAYFEDMELTDEQKRMRAEKIRKTTVEKKPVKNIILPSQRFIRCI